MMTTEELDELVEDIREHGLLEPITLYEGQVLDGRNRLAACEQADVAPRFVEWDGNGSSPITFVISHNLYRRNLTPAQKAAIAVDALPMLKAEAKERMVAGKTPDPKINGYQGRQGRAVDVAGTQFGVGGATVSRAKAVKEKSPELFEEIKQGKLTVNAALTKAGLSRGGGLGATKHGPHFGKGDKFWEVIKGLQRYIGSWNSQKFAVLNPAEAEKRLKALDRFWADSEPIREELAFRAQRSEITRNTGVIQARRSG
jgi:hypothetical protein